MTPDKQDGFCAHRSLSEGLLGQTPRRLPTWFCELVGHVHLDGARCLVKTANNHVSSFSSVVDRQRNAVLKQLERVCASFCAHIFGLFNDTVYHLKAPVNLYFLIKIGHPSCGKDAQQWSFVNLLFLLLFALFFFGFSVGSQRKRGHTQGEFSSATFMGCAHNNTKDDKQ